MMQISFFNWDKCPYTGRDSYPKTLHNYNILQPSPFIKAVSRNEFTQMAQDFCSFSRIKNGCTASITIFTTQWWIKSGIYRLGACPGTGKV